MLDLKLDLLTRQVDLVTFPDGKFDPHRTFVHVVLGE